MSFFKKFIITIHAKDYKHLFSKTETSLDLDISFIKKGEEFNIISNSELDLIPSKEVMIFGLNFSTNRESGFSETKIGS